jgi:PHD/YefM family antitoxin component YafN of YafNO toxin-antitoxin module
MWAMSDEQDEAKEQRIRYQAQENAESAQEEKTGSGAQYMVDRKGKRVGVILPFEQYRQMREDLHDLAVIAERRDEAPISLEEMKRRLREDGLL